MASAVARSRGILESHRNPRGFWITASGSRSISDRFDNMLSGEVEADETFIGQKTRNMHADVKARKITITGGKDKAMVLEILERGKDGKQSKVRTKVVDNRKKKALQAEVRQHVEAGSALFTDALKSYEGMNEFEHQVVDHAVEYVRGNVHTNGLENFWSLV
jgi:transposase-like protein